MVAIVLDGEVLFNVSMEDACLYTSNCNIDWTLHSGISHHVN
jgi:hypothetical protein